jgi:hypothetical protein
MIFITAAVEGGVTDFARLLSAALPEGPAEILALSYARRDTPLAPGQDCFLHLSGYGYAKRGAPVWLVHWVRKHRASMRSFGVFFHELYASGMPWRSSFWFSPLQRYVARAIAEMSDYWITSRQAAAEWLERGDPGKPCATLPVFSNVGESPAFNRGRSPSAVVFGSAVTRSLAYTAAGPRLFDWAQRHSLIVNDIGPPIRDPQIASLLADYQAKQHGKLAAGQVAELLGAASFGLLAYPSVDLAKSGVFAAYCAHGAAPALLTAPYLAADGLRPGTHYLTGFRDAAPGAACATIGESAWSWYQGHRLQRHTQALLELARSRRPQAGKRDPGDTSAPRGQE